MQHEALLLSNDDGDYCIVTYDNEQQDWQKISLFRSTGQFVMFSSENPDGDMLPVPMDDDIIKALEGIEKILYVNLSSETAEPIEEGWLPFNISD